MTRWALTLATVAAVGCTSTPPIAPDGSDPDAIQGASAEALTRTLAEAEAARTQERWLEAWSAYEKAATLDTGRMHDAEIANGRFAVGRALAIDGVGVDLWGLLADRRRGIEMLLATARQHRYSDVAPQALYFAAKAYIELDEPDFAQIYLDQLVNNYGESDWAEVAEYERAQALLKAARTLEHDLGPLEEAHWRLQMYLELYPHKPNTEKATESARGVVDNLAERDFRTATWYEWRDQPDAARIYYTEVARRFPGSTWATWAQARLDALPPPAEVWPPQAGADDDAADAGR